MPTRKTTTTAPRRSDRDKRLAGFAQHGFRVRSTSGDHARGACPLCGSTTRNPFSVKPEGHVWKCMTCGEGGGFRDFLAAVQVLYARELKGPILRKLSKDRGLPEVALLRWGVGWSTAGKFFTIPVRDHAGAIVGLHRYDPSAKKEFRLLSTTGGKNGLFLTGPSVDADAVWACEGEWDAIALDHALREVGSDEAVVGVSGATSSSAELALACQGKAVRLVLDADTPGAKGDVAIREALQGRALQVESVHWPDDSPEKYDVRDLWVKFADKPRKFLCSLRSFLRDAPRQVADAGTDPTRDAFKSRGAVVAGKLSGAAVSWTDVVRRYRKWLHLPDADVLDVVFGTVLGNRLDGSPLWMFVVGPPGCGKSAVLMSLSGAPLVVARTTITRAALVCGMRTMGGSDPSLLPKLDKQVLVVKDFTTILSKQEKDREELFALLRDAFDGHCTVQFGGKLPQEYHSRFGILAGTTPTIETLGPTHTVTGERFVKFYMRYSSARVGAGKQAVRRAAENRRHHTKMNRELADIAMEVLSRTQPDEPETNNHEIDRICGMAMWTAKMRGAVSYNRYTRELEYKPTTEIGTRLSEQFMKLAAGVAIFRGKRKIGPAELAIVARVARDSAPDIVEEIVHQMYVHSRDEYVATGDIAKRARLPWDVVGNRLRDMRMLGVAEQEKGGKESYRLTRSLVRMMQGLDLYAGEKTWRRRA